MRGMNDATFIVPATFALIIGVGQLAWYVGVIVLLYRIWKRVKHLPTHVADTTAR